MRTCVTDDLTFILPSRWDRPKVPHAMQLKVLALEVHRLHQVWIVPHPYPTWCFSSVQESWQSNRYTSTFVWCWACSMHIIYIYIYLYSYCILSYLQVMKDIRVQCFPVIFHWIVDTPTPMAGNSLQGAETGASVRARTSGEKCT